MSNIKIRSEDLNHVLCRSQFESDVKLIDLVLPKSYGMILKTIDLHDCRITGFEFQDDYIWCINDTTVLYDTTISHYPFSCIYKYSKIGEQLDTIFAVDRSNINMNRIVCFDSDYKKIEDNAFDIDYVASDLAYTNNGLWICDRKNKILRKIE